MRSTATTSTHRIPFQILGSLVLGLVLLAATGCDTVGSSADDAADTEPGSNTVTVGFSLASSDAKSGVAAKASDDTTLVVEGSNGTLRLYDVRLIVAEMKLKVEDDSTGEGPDFETPATYLDLPLSATTVAPVASAEIPEDTYKAFEFEVEDVDPSDDDLSVEEREHLEALFNTIRESYEDWPVEASMVVVGTFTPTEGETDDFRVYFDAEIEVELEFDPPLEVTADGLSRSVTVRLDPAQWFLRPDGSVLNLTEFDYAATEALFELEAEFEDGVTEIEVGDGEDG